MAKAVEQVAQMGGTDDMRAALMSGYENSIAIRTTAELARVRAEVDPVGELFGLANPAT